MDRRKGQICLFFAFTLAGTSVISARLISERLGTFTISAMSLVFALALLLPLTGGALRKSLQGLSRGRLLLILLQAFFGIFLFRMFLLTGLRFTSAAEAGILTGATPAFTALFAAIFLRERSSRKKRFGILSTVCGILLVQGLLGFGRLSSKHLGGNLLVLCAAASESAFNIFSRAAATATQQSKPINELVQTTLVTAAALIFCLVPALFESPIARLLTIGPVEWIALFWYGAVVTALAFLCWFKGIRRCGAFTAAAFSGMIPLTSMLLSCAVLGETVGWRQWLGGALIILGMFLIGGKDASGTEPSAIGAAKA